MMERVTLVLPYFNEERFLAATLASLGAQHDRDFTLILVDNGSTDGSDRVARSACGPLQDIALTWLREDRPGKIHALRAGLEAARDEIVVTLDADTIYPPEYVARIRRQFMGDPAVAAVLAWGRPAGRIRAGLKQRLEARLWPRKCHTGGFGQAFRRDRLQAAGGFDADRWPFVLEDHEIVHRVSRLGTLSYQSDHVCHPSDRRTDRSGCNWTLWERLQYKLLPQFALDRFFYRYLARRFEKRGLSNLRLRIKTWDEPAA
jgi:glycosyltransferase involved in cell wall biosynthesis